jgi:PDZ domain-containing secreted protein/Zn-dependent protease
LFVFGLVVWSLSNIIFPATHPGLDGSSYLMMGLVSAALFFASVVLHEIGHAFRALKEGVPIDGITLWLFGGVARLRGNPPSPGAELRVAVAGPVITLALVCLFGAAALIADAAELPASARAVLHYVTRINGLVLAFNLVPALPLDGGRVLRTWLWRRQGSFLAATRSAGRTGQVFGAVLIAIGLLSLIGGPGVGGIWLAFIGWFIVQAAQSETVAAEMRQTLRGVRVRDAMNRDPVVMAREERRVGDVMVGADEVTAVNPDQELFEALSQVSPRTGGAVVLEDGRLVGVLSSADIIHALQVEQARQPQDEVPARRPGVLVWVVVGLILVAAGAALYHPAYVVIAPGEATNVVDDVNISGVPVDEVDGRYLLTSVSISRPSALRMLIAALRADRQVLPLASVVPRGVDAEDYFQGQRDVLRQSRLLAAAAAAESVGMDASISGTGARVVDVLRGSGAAEKIREGDVIVRVDTRPVDGARSLQEITGSRPAGVDFRLTVERDGGQVEEVVESRPLPRLAGGVGLGLVVETRDLDVDLPFEISFDERDIGGPSAGLAYALAIADKLTPGDEARGRSVAATGTVDLDGEVGPVGGVKQKALAAEEAGASLFLVPVDEVEEAEETGLQVGGVANLDRALKLLDARA